MSARVWLQENMIIGIPVSAVIISREVFPESFSSGASAAESIPVPLKMPE